MINFFIEKKVPIPVTGKNGSIASTLRSMEIGDSVFLAGKKITDISPPKKAAQKHSGFVFTARTVDGGVRIWRVE